MSAHVPCPAIVTASRAEQSRVAMTKECLGECCLASAALVVWTNNTMQTVRLGIVHGLGVRRLLKSSRADSQTHPLAAMAELPMHLNDHYLGQVMGI